MFSYFARCRCDIDLRGVLVLYKGGVGISYPVEVSFIVTEFTSRIFLSVNSANMAGLENLARSMLPNTTVTMMMEISYKVTEMLINMMDSYSGG